MSESEHAVSSGVEAGAIMAMILSWHVNHSILWALAHGICSWGYVIYYAICKAG
jgi:hypothetical protein